MLLLFEDQTIYENYSPEEFQAEIAEHSKWIEQLGDRYLGGDPLEMPAKHIRGNGTMVTDGPFIEAKELVSGFYMIKAASHDEASDLAKGCPILRLGGSVEIREVMDIPAE